MIPISERQGGDRVQGDRGRTRRTGQLRAALFGLALASCSIEPIGGDAGKGGAGIQITPIERFGTIGVEGGAVSPSSRVYTVSNNGELVLEWAASTQAAWLMVDPGGGSLEPGQSQDLLVQIEANSASGLAAGLWSSTIQVTDLSSGSSELVEVRLTLHSPGRLTVTPATEFDVTGPVGGPFEPSSATYTVRNDGQSEALWEVDTETTWLTIVGAPLGGVLAPGESAPVLVQIDEPVAANLDPGVHPCVIRFFNLSTEIETLVDASVSVENVGDFKVLPFEGYELSGQEGGPFAAAEQTYRLRNDALVALDWSVEASQPWVLFVGPVTGNLAPGEEIELTVQPDLGLVELFDAGEYSATMTFEDVTSSEQWTLPVDLLVTVPGQLELSTPGPPSIAGPQGGPFTPTAQTYSLMNSGGTTLDWVAEIDVPWLTIQGPQGGAALPAIGFEVQVSVVAALAMALPAGVHNAIVRFRDATNLLAIERPVVLTVTSAPALIVLPASAIDFGGEEGGPFLPGEVLLEVRNNGSVQASWVASSLSSWLELPPGLGGVLAPGASATFPVSIGQTGDQLAIGSHEASIEFTVVGSLEPFHECAVRLTVDPDHDESGWTIFTPSVDTRQIYVSASLGSDSNSGLSEALPVRSLEAGRALLRDGYPDWMLLKRGDTWNNSSLSSWRLSGRSANEPMLVGAYGSESLARPLVLTPADGSFITTHSSTPMRFVTFVSLQSRPTSRSLDGGGNGVGLVHENFSNIHFEDLYVSGFGDNVQLRGPSNHQGGLGTAISLYRCVIVDSYRSPSHGQGMLAVSIDGLSVRECIIDHNGWNLGLGVMPTGFKRNVYIQSDCENMDFSRNHCHRSSSDGIQARAGGIVNRNLMVGNPKGFAFGHRNGGQSKVGGATGEARQNAILDSFDLPGSNGGFGISVGNINSGGCVVEDNIIARGGSTAAVGYGLMLTSVNNGYGNEPIENLLVCANVIYATDRPLYINGVPGVNLTNVRIEQNALESSAMGVANGRAGDMLGHTPTTPVDLFFEGNRYSSTRPPHQWFRVGSADVSFQSWSTMHGEQGGTSGGGSWPDPNRTVEGYLDHIEGSTGSTAEDFFARLRLQRKGQWNSDLATTPVINYIRAGFGLTPFEDL